MSAPAQIVIAVALAVVLVLAVIVLYLLRSMARDSRPLVRPVLVTE